MRNERRQKWKEMDEMIECRMECQVITGKRGECWGAGGGREGGLLLCVRKETGVGHTGVYRLKGEKRSLHPNPRSVSYSSCSHLYHHWGALLTDEWLQLTLIGCGLVCCQPMASQEEGVEPFGTGELSICQEKSADSTTPPPAPRPP